MSFTVNNAFVNQFNGNVGFLAQQKESRLRKTVIEQQITGESAYIEQMAPTAARRKQSRHSDSPIMNTQHLRRRIAPYDYEWGDLADILDLEKMLVDPTSKYTMAAGFAMGRAFDDEIIAAFFSVAYTGHTGSTAVTWPNGNSESTPIQAAGAQVAVNAWNYGTGSGNAGLTISKLIEAGVALDAAEGDDDEERWLVLTARAKGQLLATTEATSDEFNEVKALAQGKIDKFMGFNIVRSERVLLNGSGQYRIPAYRGSAMGVGVAKDINTQVGPRPDKGFAPYIYTHMSIGAARLEESKLVEIICT